MATTDLYLDDLKEERQMEWILFIKKHGNKELSKAIDEGETIIIGQTYDNANDCKVA